MPFFDSVKAPWESGSGVSLFATHTTISGNFLYHSPKYHALELGGAKSPSSNLWLEETKVFEPVMGCDGDMVSAAVEKFEAKNRNREVKKMKTTFICVLYVGPFSRNLQLPFSTVICQLVYNVSQCRSQQGTVIKIDRCRLQSFMHFPSCGERKSKFAQSSIDFRK